MIWKWPYGPLYRFQPNFSKCSDWHENHPMANLTVLNLFLGSNTKSNTLKQLKKCILKFWDRCDQMLVQPNFYDTFCILVSFQITSSLNFQKNWKIFQIFRKKSSLVNSSQTWFSRHRNCSESNPNFLLIILIYSTFCWISDFFNISCYFGLHHIYVVSSFDFAPKVAWWLHNWIFKNWLQLNLNSMSSSLGASHHLGNLFAF